MNVGAAHSSPAFSPSAAGVAFEPRATSFASHLDQVLGEGTGVKLRDAVENLVSSALVLPALATLRETSLAATPFAPGAAEKRFGPMLDQRLADEITASANFPLVDTLTSRLARRYGLMPAEMGANIQEPLHA